MSRGDDHIGPEITIGSTSEKKNYFLFDGLDLHPIVLVSNNWSEVQCLVRDFIKLNFRIKKRDFKENVESYPWIFIIREEKVNEKTNFSFIIYFCIFIAPSPSLFISIKFNNF
jgi:hypothetical protein